MKFPLILLVACPLLGCGRHGGGADAVDGSPDARDGSAASSDASEAGPPDVLLSKATGLYACGPQISAPFCLMDPPYLGVWEDRPDDVWLIESDFQEITGRHWDGQKWTTYPLGESSVAGIWGSASDDVWAVGAAGTILHWDGQGWLPHASGVDFDLRAVWGSGPSDVWAVGATSGGRAATLHWDGAAWANVPCGAASDAGAPQELLAVWGSGPADVWAVGSEGAAGGAPSPYAMRWNGASWVPALVAGAELGLTSVWGSGPDDVWIGTTSKVLHYDGNAVTSTPVFGTIAALWGSGDHDVWAVLGQGGTLHWDGLTWTSVASGTTNALDGVWGSSSTDAWAVGPAGTVLNWIGGAWTVVADGSTGPLSAVWGTGKKDIWTSGPMHWDGDGWTQGSGISFLPFTGICGSSSDDVWAVGPNLAASNGTGYIAHWDGSAWTIDPIEGVYDPFTSVSPSLGPSTLSAIWCDGASDAWAVGQFTAITGPVVATIVHWNGAAWTPSTSPTTQPLYGVWGSATDDVWATGGAGTLLHWDGSAWTSMAGGTSADLGSVWGTGASDVWVAVQLQPLFLHWNGVTWNLIDNGTQNANLVDIWGARSDDIWAVGSSPSGVVVHWDGVAWAQVWNAPASVSGLSGVWGTGPSLFVVANNGMIFAHL